MTITSVNPRTGATQRTTLRNTSASDVAELAAQAGKAAPEYRRITRRERATFLRAVADRLDEQSGQLAETAESETALGLPRLTGEVGRTTFQLRAFADVVEEGSYLEVTIDSAGDTAMGPRPELRRTLVPVGPVAVFGASNFPFAFSVCGGDTAAALAAGCPVVIKAHSAHPLTSQRTFECLEQAARDTGMPAGIVALVFGREAGQALVQDAHIQAVGFTGSESGGRALYDLANSRPDPIPFYGELGSVNPLVVTPAAAESRGQEIAAGYVGSVTLGGGQFCTKPSLVFVPSGGELPQQLAEEVGKADTHCLLTEGIYRSYGSGVAELEAAVELLGRGGGTAGEGFAVQPTLFRISGEAFAEHRRLLLTECFGPVGIVVEYSSTEQLLALIRKLPGALVGTLHADPEETSLAGQLLEALSERVGRVVWNGYPTGVAVTWGMMHGGPYPASTSLHTSVGQTSVRRFLRPVSYQSVPEELLPEELKGQGQAGTPRRVEGVLTVD